MGPELFHAEGQTDRYDKVIVATRNFANAHKNWTNNNKAGSKDKKEKKKAIRPCDRRFRFFG
jgi:hypothetical protein